MSLKLDRKSLRRFTAIDGQRVTQRSSTPGCWTDGQVEGPANRREDRAPLPLSRRRSAVRLLPTGSPPSPRLRRRAASATDARTLERAVKGRSGVGQEAGGASAGHGRGQAERQAESVAEKVRRQAERAPRRGREAPGRGPGRVGRCSRDCSRGRPLIAAFIFREAVCSGVAVAVAYPGPAEAPTRDAHLLCPHSSIVPAGRRHGMKPECGGRDAARQAPAQPGVRRGRGSSLAKAPVAQWIEQPPSKR